MTNRKNLHDYGLVLILFGVLNLFNFAASVVAGLVDGSVIEALAAVDAEIAVAVKVMLGILGALMVIVAISDALVGLMGLKVSAKPTAATGHITAAKIFLVFSALSAVSSIFSLFDSNANVVNTVLNLASSGLSVVAYIYFIKSAQAVRRDVLNGESK